MKTAFAKIWRLLDLSKTLQLFVMRLFQDQFLIGVTGVVFNEKNEILFVKHTYRGTLWSLPGGYIHAKEHPAEALEREIAEETGFVTSIDDRLDIKTDRETARLDISYMGVYSGGEFKKSSEVSQANFFSFNNLPLIRTDQLLLIAKAIRRKKAMQEKFRLLGILTRNTF